MIGRKWLATESGARMFLRLCKPWVKLTLPSAEMQEMFWFAWKTLIGEPELFGKNKHLKSVTKGDKNECN